MTDCGSGRPLLSIVTVCFNDCRRLAGTVESVAVCATGVVEYLVVDGGSSDGTLELLEQAERAGGLTRWVSGPDRGIYDAMNKGISLASGEYLYFLNAGDELVPAGFGKALEILAAGNPQLLCAKVFVAGSPYESDFGRVFGSPVHSRADFERGMPVCHQGIFYRRDTLGNGYDLSFRNIADRKLTWEIVKRFGSDSVAFLDEVVARYAGGNLAERRFGIYMVEELRWALWFPGGTAARVVRLARLLASFAVKGAKRLLKKLIGDKAYARLKHGGN